VSKTFEAGRALAIKSRISAVNAGRPASAGGHIYFMGYVQYRDLMANRFATGFFFLHTPEGFSIASPVEVRMTEGDRYNYDRRLN